MLKVKLKQTIKLYTLHDEKTDTFTHFQTLDDLLQHMMSPVSYGSKMFPECIVHFTNTSDTHELMFCNEKFSIIVTERDFK